LISLLGKGEERAIADEIDSIIPISDNGGSSSELIRVFGGPGIGDVRSMFSLFHSFSSLLL
jgi:hypothetical protein